MNKILFFLAVFLAVSSTAFSQPGTGNPLVYAPHTYGYNAVSLTNLPASQLNGALTSLTMVNTTNTPSFTLVNTNWISGKLYTNFTGRPILVQVNTILTDAATSGGAIAALQCAGVFTNTNGVQNQLTVTVTSWGELSGYIPAGSNFVFTNVSTGSGNSVAFQGGQYMVY